MKEIIVNSLAVAILFLVILIISWIRSKSVLDGKAKSIGIGIVVLIFLIIGSMFFIFIANLISFEFSIGFFLLISVIVAYLIRKSKKERLNSKKN